MGASVFQDEMPQVSHMTRKKENMKIKIYTGSMFLMNFLSTFKIYNCVEEKST